MIIIMEIWKTRKKDTMFILIGLSLAVNRHAIYSNDNNERKFDLLFNNETFNQLHSYKDNTNGNVIV